MIRVLPRGGTIINTRIINLQVIICKYSSMEDGGCIMGGGVAAIEGLVGKNPVGFLRSADTDRPSLVEEQMRVAMAAVARISAIGKEQKPWHSRQQNRLRGRRKDAIDDVRNGRLSQNVRRLGFNALPVLSAPSTPCISESAFRLSAALIADFWYRWLSRR